MAVSVRARGALVKIHEYFHPAAFRPVMPSTQRATTAPALLVSFP